MSIYHTNEDTQYVLNYTYNPETKDGECDCSTAIINGREKLLHNEVSFGYKIENGEIHVTSGSHIGTEDFDFSEEEGDDCNFYVEEYHPGLLNQLVKELLKEKFYYAVSFQYSEHTFCSNIAHAENAEKVYAHYGKYNSVSVTRATDSDVKLARAKGMPIVEI